MIRLEVCANSATSALAAQQGGAARVELCENIHEGGTTPSYGQVKIARKLLTIPLHVLLRPRAGDFLYTPIEINIIKANLVCYADAGCDGIVVGFLNNNGTINIDLCAEIISMAREKNLSTTFHRAFDVCADLHTSLEQLISLGFDRVLTSGGKPTAIEGASKIAQLVQQAAGRIIIMPGGGITEHNAYDIVAFTGVTEIHSSARVRKNSDMVHHNDLLTRSSHLVTEYEIELTSTHRVNQIINQANKSVTDLKYAQG